MSPPRFSALAYNLYLKHDLLRVSKAFQASGLPFLLLKGASLAEAAYGGLAERPMVDTDLVVLPSQVVEAHRVLLALGFYDRPGNDLELNLAADYEHPMHYPHNDVETGLELHWHIYPPELFRGAVEPYFQRAVMRSVCGVPMLTLNNEDRLLQLATHWAQHGLSKPAVLRDIETLWNLRSVPAHRVEVDILVRRLREVGALDVFSLALLSIEQRGRLHEPIPGSLRTARAELFHRWLGRRLPTTIARNSHLLEPASDASAAEHRLRLLGWLLLSPAGVWSSGRRELLPSAARLERIAGNRLTTGETAASFVRRQTRGVWRLLSRS